MPITLDPPATGDFTITLNSPNGSNDTDSLKMTAAADANLLRGYLKALPGGDFTVTAKFQGTMSGNFNGMAIMFRDSAGKYVVVGIGHNNGAELLIGQWSDHTTFSSNATALSIGQSEWPTWFRVAFTSATSDLQAYYSYTGDNWVALGASNTYLGTADAYGIGIISSSATLTAVGWFEHFATA